VRKGFSLIEVLLGILIFSFVSGGIGIFISSVFKQSDFAECQTIAKNAAQGQFERIRLLMDPDDDGETISFNQIPEDTTAGGYNNHVFNILHADGVRDQRFQGVSRILILSPNSVQITIQVTWTTPLSGNRSYTLTSSLAQTGS
jgi:prepilin-type N-terminal cleavage/methylation domain-containing protein